MALPSVNSATPAKKIVGDGGGMPCALAHSVWCSMPNPFVKLRQKNPTAATMTPTAKEVGRFMSVIYLIERGGQTSTREQAFLA